MNRKLRFDIADERLAYKGSLKRYSLNNDRLIEFNHRHTTVLANYDLALVEGNIFTLCDKINNQSNLGALRNRQIRESVILSAALSAAAVGLHGRGNLNQIPKEKVTQDITNELKRANDRTAAHIMAEVLQTTTEMLPVGEEVLIESTITEGVRVKPGKEAGGNPTISVGALFGKKEHSCQYGLSTPQNVTLLSMGNDVIDGTTKSVKGLHSSLTALFITESNVKRHLPDIYVQRWMSGEYFEEFNPREASLMDAAEIIAHSYGFSSPDRLSAFFLDRKRHYPAMEILNNNGIATPYDKDGDLFPAIILGSEDVTFPNDRRLHSMIGEIGGSAEWAVGVLPLVWRGGQAIGMLTSQSSLSRRDLTPEELWKERNHYTEEEFMLIQDARFEQKPYFTIKDILEEPFAGGISAFGGITDNYYLPSMKGVASDKMKNTVTVNTLTINSLGIMECWELTFKCKNDLTNTIELMKSPKEKLAKLENKELEKAVGKILSNERLRKRFRIFFNNEYYPALIPVRDRMVLLPNAVNTLIERGALGEKDRKIIDITKKLTDDWFIDAY
ncbi:MAG: fructose-bisphosphatase class II [candidate division Zixibacteria bacterium]|nr:fructose-bisphosphatase class II [candidate division Zixibacteria bacterium]